MSQLVTGRTGDWEVVIGLEVHAQVSSKAKLFSGASASFGAAPNAHVSLVDAAMPGMLPVASGGIHVWHMPALVNIFGDNSVLQFGGGTLGHPWGNAAGAAANRVAVEACVEARNAGRELEKESKDILTSAAKHSPELKVAMETWKEIKFEFDTVDKLDIQHK